MIIDAVHQVLEKTPPELAADISDRGIYMTGGGCLIDGLDKLLEERTGINIMIAEDAVSCVALGTGKALDNLDIIELMSIVTEFVEKNEKYNKKEIEKENNSQKDKSEIDIITTNEKDNIINCNINTENSTKENLIEDEKKEVDEVLNISNEKDKLNQPLNLDELFINS